MRWPTLADVVVWIAGVVLTAIGCIMVIWLILKFSAFLTSLSDWNSV